MKFTVYSVICLEMKYGVYYQSRGHENDVAIKSVIIQKVS